MAHNCNRLRTAHILCAVATLTAAPTLTQAEESKGVPVHYLTDEELLSRFPGQPVGLVGSGSSSQFIGFTNTPEE